MLASAIARRPGRVQVWKSGFEKLSRTTKGLIDRLAKTGTMVQPSEIIKFLDRHMESSGEQFITPVDANQLLDQAGLLQDEATKPGLPLRRLIRDGHLPHAYQDGRWWRIPHSRRPRSK